MYSIYKICDLDTGKLYIGSTKQKINQRLNSHKYKSKKGISRCSCRDFNWDNVTIEEIELVEIEHLQRERYHINNIECVNKDRPIVTEEERKEKLRECTEKIKEEGKEKITCECGCIVTRNCLSRHRKTKKHQYAKK